MEESLESYVQAENECRAQCEGPFDHGWFPDFIASISSKLTWKPDVLLAEICCGCGQWIFGQSLFFYFRSFHCSAQMQAEM